MIVTLDALRLGTAEATRLAMPRTAPGSTVDGPPPSRTDAVAGFCWSAKSCSWGMVSCTVAPETPSTWPIVCAIWVSSARW